MATTRLLPFLLAAAAGAGSAQTLLPSKPAAGKLVSPPASTLPAAAPTTSTTLPGKPQHRGEVIFGRGVLAVKADNSSLNQILREIGSLTGIKITGGVAEERVYGHYGPGSPTEVLSALLDGTGSNMLLVASADGVPGELVLTPRRGGVTPPNPNATGFDDDNGDDVPPPAAFVPRTQELPPPTIGPQREAAGDGAMPATAAAPDAAVTQPGTAAPTDPNGVKTPQQIFEQLQRLRQQQQTARPPQ